MTVVRHIHDLMLTNILFCLLPIKFTKFTPFINLNNSTLGVETELSVNIFLRFTALLLTAFMLIVSTGASVSIHYCNGNVIDFAINKRAEACEGYYQDSSDSPTGCSISRKECCEDVDRVLLVENEFPPSQTYSVQNNGILDLLITELPRITVLPTPKIDCLANAPPLIETDYQVLFQVFVI